GKVVHVQSLEHGHGPGADLLGGAVVDAQRAGPALHADATFREKHLPARNALMSPSAAEQVVGSRRQQGTDQRPFLRMILLGLVHHNGSVGKRRFLLLQVAAGGPYGLEPFLFATLLEDVQVSLKDLPDPTPLLTGHCPATARA